MARQPEGARTRTRGHAQMTMNPCSCNWLPSLPPGVSASSISRRRCRPISRRSCCRPELGQAWPFRIEEASRYDARGPGWYWNNFSCSEHTGTHFDAPIHWISGRHLPDNSTDTIPATRFIAPACVLDCSREAAADADFLLTVDFLRKWERRHGRIAAGSWILMRTDWSKRTRSRRLSKSRRDRPAHAGTRCRRREISRR